MCSGCHLEGSTPLKAPIVIARAGEGQRHWPAIEKSSDGGRAVDAAVGLELGDRVGFCADAGEGVGGSGPLGGRGRLPYFGEEAETGSRATVISERVGP